MKNKKTAMTLAELLIFVAIFTIFVIIIIANISNMSTPQQGSALQVDVTAPAIKSEVEQRSTQKFICESIKVDSIIASGSEVQQNDCCLAKQKS